MQKFNKILIVGLLSISFSLSAYSQGTKIETSKLIISNDFVVVSNANFNSVTLGGETRSNWPTYTDTNSYQPFTLSKAQWEFIGKTAGWTKFAQDPQDIQEQSLKDKMFQATHLSLQIAFATITPDGHYLETKEIDLPDKVWAWADGLTYKYYENQVTGKTSLSNIINFDIEQFEQEIDRDIIEFQKLLKKVGTPKKLTKEEMIAKGYKQK